MILLWWVLPVPLQALAFIAVLIAASALQTQPMHLHERRRVVASVARVEVCTKKHCKKKGSLKTLRIFEALAPDGVEVLTARLPTSPPLWWEAEAGAPEAPCRLYARIP